MNSIYNDSNSLLEGDGDAFKLIFMDLGFNVKDLF